MSKRRVRDWAGSWVSLEVPPEMGSDYVHKNNVLADSSLCRWRHKLEKE